MHIKVRKGLDIPIAGSPSKYLGPCPVPKQVAYDFTPFQTARIALKVKLGDRVKKGEPLAEDKWHPGRYFVAPIAGHIAQIHRGDKRALERVVIESDASLGEKLFASQDATSRDKLIALLQESGLMAAIFSRPCGHLADPTESPKSIFVQAVNSAPFDPPFELEIEDERDFFFKGLSALSLIAPIHVVFRKGKEPHPLPDLTRVHYHTVEGPHPAGDPSLHIAHIDPIRNSEERIWTLTASTVIHLGHLLATGRLSSTRLIALAGEGIDAERCGYYKATIGQSLSELVGETLSPRCRLISGNPLIGQMRTLEGFLGFSDRTVCALPTSQRREPLHFFRAGADKYTATRAYLSGLLKRRKPFSFTTSQHGEHRAIIDGSIYMRVMPLRIPVAPLIKALIAKNYEMALELGLLEVVPEDFALSEFICPSKTPFTKIVREALLEFSAEYMNTRS